MGLKRGITLSFPDLVLPILNKTDFEGLCNRKCDTGRVTA